MEENSKLSRISKLFVDRDQASIEEALKRRQNFRVTLVCGEDVVASYILQLAVLTAANIASRCFPGAVRVEFPSSLRDAPLRLWPSLNLTLGQALGEIVGSAAFQNAGEGKAAGHAIIFGNAPQTKGALRVTFDGWIAKVGPADAVARLPEREFCAPVGVLGAALAMSESFLSFADISVQAWRRTLALSLWRPDADPDDPVALGVPVEFLPRGLWFLGLGHLGNAYLWSIATLPYQEPRAVQLMLHDFDKVESENIETGLLFLPEFIGELKTQACRVWLRRRQFATRLVERPFDSSFRCREDEPRVALCGFDSNPARRDLATARFLRVVESGLGGTTNNFDTISLHTLPNPRSVGELWPDLSPAEEAKHKAQQERLAKENPAYAQFGGDDCGRYDLAGKSIAVPFVGAAAAALVLAEMLRVFHDGPAYTDVKLNLGSLSANCIRRTADCYGIDDINNLRYADAMKLGA